MEIKNSLKTILKRLKLSGILATLPERIAYAQKARLPSEDLLELILQDEVDRRDQVNLQRRLTPGAGKKTPACTLRAKILILSRVANIFACIII